MIENVENQHVQRETTDIRFRPILVAIVALAISLALAGATTRWMVHRQGNDHAREATARSDSPDRSLPAEPRLEPLDVQAKNSRGTFVEQQRDQDALLHSLSPTDDPQFVHVPIEHAIGHLAKQLQAEPSPPERSPKSQGLTNGGEANSGRLLRKASP